ncbi:MAG: AI-2E family transporter [Candidatus Ornithospirochaeta sp.]|nr:AI-2E family transporter [Sphaerochaetaceae bacterium]MDY5523830.1 AI-2E family transporter [Candidatus Ornithospirochaeta sp.]
MVALLLVVVLFWSRISEALSFLTGILKPFILGGALAFILNLPLSFLEKKVFRNLKGRGEKFKRPLSIFLSLVFVLLLILILLLTVVPEVISAFESIISSIPSLVTRVESWSNDVLTPVLKNNPELLKSLETNWDSLLSKSLSFLKDGLSALLSSTLVAANSLISSITSFVVALIFAIYVLGDKERLERQFRSLLKAYTSKEAEEYVLHVFSVLHRSFSSFISGQCLEAVILGSIFILVLSILRFPYSVMIGVVVMFSALLPIVGAFIACFFGAFIILLSSPVKALYFVVIFLIIQQLENNLIYPRVVGSSVGLPALWVFFAVTLGGALFGVVGMLFFIPVFSALFVLLKEDVGRRIRLKEEKENAPQRVQ